MIPQLPTEVTSHIIQLSLPHPSFDSLGERADLLLSYSLVSRIWRALAQHELFKHAVIKNRQAAGGFTAALEEAGAGLRERVTSLRFGSGSNDLDAPEFDRWVVLELTSLVELWVLGVRNLKLSSVAGSGHTLKQASPSISTTAEDAFPHCEPSFVDPLYRDLLSLLQAVSSFPNLADLTLARINDYHETRTSTQGRTISLLSFGPSPSRSSESASGLEPFNLLDHFIRQCTTLNHFRIAGRDMLNHLLAAALTKPFQHLWLSNFVKAWPSNIVAAALEA